MLNTFKTFFIIFFVSLFLSSILTLVYIKLPPFYIYSFNYAVVPDVEVSQTNFNYNNFYQSELSENLTSSLSLFAANADFKETVSKQSKINILYLMSKTNGTNLINLKLLSLSKIDPTKTDKIILNTLNKSLNYFVNDKITFKLNAMPEFNHLYVGGLSITRFFWIVFSINLVTLSIFSLLKKYYAA